MFAAWFPVDLQLRTTHPLVAELNRFNEVTHETTYTDPDEYGGPAFSPHPGPIGASPAATPFNGTMSPAAAAAAGFYAGNNGYMSPLPAMMPPASGYMSPAGSDYMSPSGFTHPQGHHHHHHYQPPQRDYPVETRSPCPTVGAGRRATPYQPEYLQLQQRQQQPRQQYPRGSGYGAPVAPFSAGSSSSCTGYRWEECYRQDNGKKFWRHKETGVILTKDPYR